MIYLTVIEDPRPRNFMTLNSEMKKHNPEHNKLKEGDSQKVGFSFKRRLMFR